MAYDLDKLATHAEQLGFRSDRASEGDLGIKIAENTVLRFMNLTDPTDTLIGFDGTPWHYHDALFLEANDGWYIELSEVELLSALRNGDVLIVELLVSGELKDRCVAHKLEPFHDLKHIEPDEEVRIRRLPQR